MKSFIHKIKAGELSYIVACILAATGIRLQVNSSLGVSMIAAPAYLLSVKIPWLTQGTAEWMVQGMVFLLMCLAIRKFAIKKIWSFIIAIPYGLLFDGISILLINVKGSSFITNLLLLLAGCLILSLGIALFFQSYLPCQMHEMFVKTIAEHYHWQQSKVKTAYDFSFLALGLVMSLLFFHKLEGIGIGTVICTIVNGPLIGFWTKVLDGRINFDPVFPKLKQYFTR